MLVVSAYDCVLPYVETALDLIEDSPKSVLGTETFKSLGERGKEAQIPVDINMIPRPTWDNVSADPPSSISLFSVYCSCEKSRN